VGVFELLEMNEPMMKALKNADTAEFSYQANLSEGYRALALAALDYAKQGITSLDEVMKLVEIVNNDGSGGNEQPLEQIDIAKAQAKQGPKTDGFSLEDVD
jgi:MSHA biogenesis protein MshE